MNKTYFYIFILISAILGRGTSFALPSDRISVDIQATNVMPTIGDSLTVICTVTTTGTIRAERPFLNGIPDFVDIEHQWDYVDSSVKDVRTAYYGFLTYVFTPDTLMVGPFVIDYVTADGDSGKALSETLTLVVKSVIGNPEPPYNPIPNRGPMNLPAGKFPFWIILLLIVCLAALLYLLHLRKKRDRPDSPIRFEPIDEIAEFDKIRALMLHENGHIKELYILISHTLRGFIHRNMGCEALSRTTREIMNDLSKNTKCDNSVRKAIGDMLAESDMVKYARYLPPLKMTATVIDRSLEPVKSVLAQIAREKALLAAEAEKLSRTDTEPPDNSDSETVVAVDDYQGGIG